MKKHASETTKVVFTDLSDVVSKVVGGVIQFAPFGIFGLVFTAISESGLSIFKTYGKLLILLVGCMLLVSLVINPIIASVMLRQNAYWRFTPADTYGMFTLWHQQRCGNAGCCCRIYHRNYSGFCRNSA